MSNKVWHLESKVINCNLEIFINGIPIYYHKKSYDQLISVPINQYIVNGKNIVEVIVNPGKTPSVSKFKGTWSSLDSYLDKEVGFAVQIVEYSVGQYVGSGGNQQASLVHMFDNTKYIDASAFDTVFNVKDRINVWGWQLADKLPPVSTQIDKIHSIVEYIHSKISAKDASAYLEIADRYYSDYYLAYPDQEASPQQQLKYALEVSGKDWEFESLNKDLYDFRLCADNRLIQLYQNDWQTVIRTVPTEESHGESAFKLPIFIGFLDGRWQVLR